MATNAIAVTEADWTEIICEGTPAGPETARAMLVAAAINRLALRSSQQEETPELNDLLQTRADLARVCVAANTFLKKQTAVNFSELNNLLTELAAKYNG